VRVGGRGQCEPVLKVDLGRCVIEQVGAANDVSHTLISVIDHDRKQVRKPSIATLENEVPGGERYILPKGALDAIRELHEPGLDSQPDRQFSVGLSGSVATVTRITRLGNEVESTA